MEQNQIKMEQIAFCIVASDTFMLQNTSFFFVRGDRLLSG